MVNSDIDKEANNLKESVGDAENFNKTKEITGISRKVGHSDSCLAFLFLLKIRPGEYINQVLEMSTGKRDIHPRCIPFFSLNNALNPKILNI